MEDTSVSADVRANSSHPILQAVAAENEGWARKLAFHAAIGRGPLPTNVTADKLFRAFDFRAGERVVIFRLERHPVPPDPTQDTIQIWALHVDTEAFELLDEEPVGRAPGEARGSRKCRRRASRRARIEVLQVEVARLRRLLAAYGIEKPAPVEEAPCTRP